MFEELSSRISAVMRRLSGSGRLSEENIRDALREVRRALLEADVHFRVAKDLVAAVEERAVGQEVLRSLTPADQVIKIVHEELIRVLGGSSVPFELSGTPPRTVMLVGLQGVGKTTLAAKLARWFARRGSRPLLVAADTVRPAAAQQLATLGERVGVPVCRPKPGEKARQVVDRAIDMAREQSLDPAILDTQGRLHVDEELLEECVALAEEFRPTVTLLVVDAMVGQDAVRSADAFRQGIPLDGVVLTKMDGDARGGAALSLSAATGLAVRLVSTGEDTESLDLFHPERMASRILGMGDVLTLVEKAQQHTDEAEAAEAARRWQEEKFTLEDFRREITKIRRMGPLRDILSMVPGGDRLAAQGADETQMVRVEAIVNSMTPGERGDPSILNASRRRRIAQGSGTTVEEVNRLLKDFAGMERMMGAMGLSGGRGRRKRRMGFPVPRGR
jgi:signal recognition particle subunit SRP54